MGTIGLAVYRGAVVVPSGVPAAEAAVAGASVGGALTVAPRLSRQIGADLIASAKDAYTAGLNLVAVIGVVLFAGLVILILGTPRHIEPVAAETETREPELIG
ncbi:MAG: hypothetical protein M3443_09885 [Actinomycetota bacterium]|nr:hypothetical protein [Actinomycetota bacterium]